VEKEIRMVVIGKTGAGKSEICNLVTDSETFDSMSSMESQTNKCKQAPFNYAGRELYIVDTPGFADTEMDEASVKREVDKCVALSSPGIHIILFVVRIDQRFTKESKKVLDMFQTMFGKNMFPLVVVVFTGTDQLRKVSVEKAMERLPKELKKILEDCGNKCVAIMLARQSREEY